MARRQNTIGQAVSLSGSGMFSGLDVRVRLCPAEAGTGILFVRTDLPDSPVVPAAAEAAGSDFRCTVLRQGELEVHSVEHLLSACAALGVDNLVVEVTAEEMPACGGCALPYAEALLEGGILQQAPERRVNRIREPVAVCEGAASITATPAEEGLTVSYVLEFDHAALPPQVVTCRIDQEHYLSELAPARTFAPEAAYGEFAARGAGGGVTDDNALVVFRDGSVRKPRSRDMAQLRFPDECARHKIVDVLGDLALTGFDIEGRVVAVRSGHRLNTALAIRLCTALAEPASATDQYLDIREIQRVLPHRYPFLMIDRIMDMEEDNKIIGLKNVSINEHFFQGHYPGHPIMPGVLQLEALAQVAGVLLLQKLEHTGKLALLVSMDAVRLRRLVQPGDQLILEAEVVRVRSRTAQVKARALVNNEVACEAEMKFMLVSPEVV